MLQGLLSLTTAGLATLGALGVASSEGATGPVLIVVAAVLALLWGDILLLAGRDRRPHWSVLAVYPAGSFVTCGAAVWGALLATHPDPSTAALIVAAWLGGGALRLVLGTVAMHAVADRAPGSLGHQLREALATLR